MTQIVFGSNTEFDPGEGQLSLDAVEPPMRKGTKVRHKDTGWRGKIDSIRRKPIPKAKVIWENGGSNTIPLNSLERDS